MGLGIAEIGENAVAHIPRNMAPTLLDDGGAGAREFADDGAEILGIELNRKRSRAHKIAKQYGKLSPLALGNGRCHGLGVQAGCGSKIAVSERGYGPEYPLAMTECDVDLLEIRLRKMRQGLHIDRIRVEDGSVLPEAEPIQPGRYGAHEGSLPSSAAAHELLQHVPGQTGSKSVILF